MILRNAPMPAALQSAVLMAVLTLASLPVMLRDRVHAKPTPAQWLGVAWLGPTAAIVTLPPATAYVVAVADAVARETLAAQADAAGHQPVTLVHPSAVVGSDVRTSEGVVVAAHCSLTSNIAIGRHVHVDRACTVGHDAVLEDFVRLNPGAVVSGKVTMRRGSTLGTGAVTRQGVEIGAGTYVGAGAAVVSDLPRGIVAVGVPARATRDVGDRE